MGTIVHGGSLSRSANYSLSITAHITCNPFQVFEAHNYEQIKMSVSVPNYGKARDTNTLSLKVWFGAFLSHVIESFTKDGIFLARQLEGTMACTILSSK